MAKNNDWEIPVDKAILEFGNHLKAHPRTILSAKFGDGKSYFLDKVAKDKRLRKKYQFINIYPVNYQVLDNKDVFELVKHDILIQLFMNKMIPDDYHVSDSLALSMFLQNQGMGIVETLLTYVSQVDSSPSCVSALLAAIKGSKFITKLSAKYKEFKDAGTNDDILCSYLDKSEAGTTIYENDIVTKIIRDSIQEYRKRTHKKVVLIFEDMDRLDPAHMFRIMNVLSAHMDYGYRVGVKPHANSLVGNKFGVDNVVLVLDYSNLRKIFHHFYGPDTCFDGYIGKFADKGYFKYSLSEEKIKYYYDLINASVELPEDFVRSCVSPELLARLPVRQIVNSVDKAKAQIFQIMYVHDGGVLFPCHKGLPILVIIMRRMGVSEDEIRRLMASAIGTLAEKVYPYWVPYAILKDSSLMDVGIDLSKSDGIVTRASYSGMKPDGTASCMVRQYYGSSGGLYDFNSLVGWLLEKAGR